ncbi:MAG: undecaprenyl pyrophosphate phosphatase [Candidatus Methanofastidiosum methylothiophilum]|uniref:Undecaprenyl-diphosphatase n=1 Tax=Candidatus Methanofastidiosum methylothiophilum TaxID=1705564 RepID=A0A150J7X7_9EURY|nr:MAG: undecaprenyl pyrophosphate phosphatase [Candidatus Methanofastidiosum methylthiophilus]
MNLTELIIVGAIQGFLEFLPVSSSGNLTLVFMNFLNMNPSESYSISLFLHLGTLFAVIVFFYKDIIKILKKIKTDKSSHFLIVSTIFTGVVGIPIYIILKMFLEDINVGIGSIIIGIFLIATGLLLRYSPNAGTRKVDSSNFKDMAIAGAAQGISIIPGISRSGSTLTVLLARKFDKEEALRISFLMSIPAIIGGAILEIDEVSFGLTYFPALISAFIASILGIKLLLELAKKLNFSYFCIILGLITILISAIII